MVDLGRKNISRGKNKDLTDFSYLINEPKNAELEDDNKIKESDEKED